MNAIMMLPNPSLDRSAKVVPFHPAMPADELAAPGAVNGPEILLQVSFVGLDTEAQRKALGSFPGARRCRLAGN